MSDKTTRFFAVVLGCVIAAVSCLAMPGGQDRNPPKCDFEIAESVGDWQMLEQRHLQQSELAVLQASDHWQRVFKHRETMQVLVATVIAGEGGAMSCHLPEACYARTDFHSLSDAIVWKLPDREDRFRFQTLAPRNIDQPAVTIAYAWSDGSRWTAPLYPRIQLAGHPVLERLLVTMHHPNGMASDARHSIQQFIRLAVVPGEETQAQNITKANPVITSY